MGNKNQIRLLNSFVAFHLYCLMSYVLVLIVMMLTPSCNILIFMARNLIIFRQIVHFRNILRFIAMKIDNFEMKFFFFFFLIYG